MISSIKGFYNEETPPREIYRRVVEDRITSNLYLYGELSIADIAARVGVSKSPALRRILYEMCAAGTLISRWVPYKHTGKLMFDLSPDTFDTLYQRIPSMAGAEKP
mgnify:CR=1 FL=1